MAGAFSRKTLGISCDLTAFRKIKELRANAVETPLGVTGVLGFWYHKCSHKTVMKHARGQNKLFQNASLLMCFCNFATGYF